MRNVKKQRTSQLNLMKNKRSKWFKDNGPCCHCGSWEKLELDHIDPTTKISHKVWTWSAERRAIELSKCQALCEACHQIKSSKECRDRQKGKTNFKLCKYDQEISDLAIYLYVIKQFSRRQVENILNIPQGTISRWIYGPRGGEWLKRQAHGC